MAFGGSRLVAAGVRIWVTRRALASFCKSERFAGSRIRETWRDWGVQGVARARAKLSADMGLLRGRGGLTDKVVAALEGIYAVEGARRRTRHHTG